MGININISNQHHADEEIAKTQGQVEMNASNNRADVDKHTNTTNLIGEIAKVLSSLVGTVLGSSNKKE